MTDVRISEWLGLIELEVPDVPEPLVNRALIDALQQFCQGAKVWRRDLDLFDTVASQGTYTPKTPDGSKLAGIRRLEHAGNKVWGHGEVWLDNNLAPGWRGETALVSEYYYQEEPGKLRLVFAPSTAVVDTLYIRAYLKPSMSAQEVPDFLFEEERFRVAIEAGAKGFLYRMLGTVWADAKASEAWGKIFLTGLEEARGEAERDHTEEVPLVTTAPFGGIPNA